MPQSSLKSTLQLFFQISSLLLVLSLPARAEQHAILIGVWDYENPNLQLDAPPNDLRLMQEVLAARGVSEERTHILANPTKQRIQRKFRELRLHLKPSDSLLFYFSGHGTQIIDRLGTFPGDEAKGRFPDRNDEALLPVDANLASPETYLLDDELNLLLQELPTREIVCIIDTCYSGDILREIRLGRPKGAPVTNMPSESLHQTPIVSHTEDILDESADFALLLAASAYNQVVHEIRIPVRNTYLPVSAMTYSIYRKMLAGSRNSKTSGVEARLSDELTYRQLARQVQKDHEQWNLAWRPVLAGPEDRFDEVFLLGNSPMQLSETLNLSSINGKSITVNQRDLVFAGGGNLQLGTSSGVNQQRWAIVIGIDAYAPPLQPLKYAADDAKAVAGVFQEAGAAVTLMTPDSLIQPTKANIIGQLRRHAQIETVDLLTVYLSGHGEDVDGTSYFLPMDASEPLTDNGLSLEDLFVILNSAKAKHRFVIVDACRVTPKEHFVSALSRYSDESNIIFTACDSNQWAPEIPQLKHGLFTYFLLEGLRHPGAAGDDGTVTVLGLLDYVTRGIEDWYSHLSEDLHHPQQITPRVFYNGKYISLFNNQGIDPTVLNNKGLISRIINPVQPSQPTRVIEAPASPRRKSAELHLPMTISLLPWISTVGLLDLKYNVTTNLSLNIIAGYHAKLNGIELGCLLNMKGIEARGAQFVGGANIVGGNMNGIQAAIGLNCLGGTLDGFQVAGGGNIVGGDVEGVQGTLGLNLVGGHVRKRSLQMAVGGNMVGRNVEGLQGAVGLNVGGGDLNGLQVAGGGNIAGGRGRGVQAAIGLNVIGSDLDGFQGAVGGNLVGESITGVQLAIGANLAARGLNGFQGAGGLNFVGGNVGRRSLQAAFGGNIAGNLDGTQLSLLGNATLGLRQQAGIPAQSAQIAAVNIAHGAIGTQIGLLNVAGHVEGTQIGVLNVAGRMSGVPIGLINFVKDNPVHFQLWGSDTEALNLGFRIGSRHAYSLLMIGVHPVADKRGIRSGRYSGDSDRGSFGFGIGGHIPLRERFFLNVDALIRPVFYTDDWDDWWVHEHSLLHKLRIAVGWEKHKWFSVFGGLSLNILASDRLDTSDFGTGFDRVYRKEDVTIRVWPGFFAGVQF